MSRPSPQASRAAGYKLAFDAVIDHYQSLRFSTGAIRGLDYSKSGQGTNNANVLRVSPSDFVCDVELAGRRALEANPHLYSRFRDCYVLCIEEPDTQDIDIDTIRTRVGAAFTKRRMSPPSAYFKPEPIDRSNQTK